MTLARDRHLLDLLARIDRDRLRGKMPSRRSLIRYASATFRVSIATAARYVEDLEERGWTKTGARPYRTGFTEITEEGIAALARGLPDRPDTGAAHEVLGKASDVADLSSIVGKMARLVKDHLDVDADTIGAFEEYFNTGTREGIRVAWYFPLHDGCTEYTVADDLDAFGRGDGVDETELLELLPEDAARSTPPEICRGCDRDIFADELATPNCPDCGTATNRLIFDEAHRHAVPPRPGGSGYDLREYPGHLARLREDFYSVPAGTWGILTERYVDRELEGVRFSPLRLNGRDGRASLLEEENLGVCSACEIDEIPILEVFKETPQVSCESCGRQLQTHELPLASLGRACPGCRRQLAYITIDEATDSRIRSGSDDRETLTDPKERP